MTARSAAERLRTALTDHLAAVETRASEHDPAVQRAFRELRAAAADYDEALYREHDEVTPFDLPELPVEVVDDDVIDPTGAERLSVLARWDYSVLDPARLVSAATTALDQELTEPGIALAALVAAHGHGRLAAAETAESVGLRYHGATTWIAAVVDAEPGDHGAHWMDDPFAAADPELVLARLDGRVDLDGGVDHP